MKLRRVKTRTHKGEDYFKWVIHPPGAAVDALGWRDGDELEPVVKGGSLVLRRVR
ncbi:MAG TPA: hypothetical protein VM327_08120 [Candidatus Thermoplasmatota archaeon]|nr:hypothetical protein [Candidatus Thermoplasmatota archaeon]